MSLCYFLSIVVPVYNASSDFVKCIESVLSSNISDIEIILVNDGSTDESRNLCDQYEKDYNYINVIHQANQGVSAARNNGLAQASGKYVAFFDADDYVDSAEFTHLISILREEKEEVDILLTEVTHVLSSGKVSWRSDFVESSDLDILSQGEDCMHRMLLSEGSFWNVWKNIYSRNFLIKENITFLKGIAWAEDLEFSTQCFLKAKEIRFLKSYFYQYRVYLSDSAMCKLEVRRIDDTLAAIENSVRLVLNKAPLHRNLLINKFCKEYIFNISLLQKLEEKDRKIAEERFLSALWILDFGDEKYKVAKKILKKSRFSFLSKVLHCLKWFRRKSREII